MNTKTVCELRSIAKDKDLHSYYRLQKADLIALLLKQSAEEMLTSLTRVIGEERRAVPPLKIISNPQEMDDFEKEEIIKGRPVVKNKLTEWYDSLVDYVPKSIKHRQQSLFKCEK